MDDRKQIDADRYRFGGLRVSLRGPSTFGPDDIILEEAGLYPFPKHEELDDESSSSES